MNKLLIAFYILSAVGCSTTGQTNSERVDEEIELAKANHERAEYLGKLPGTPENIDAVERAEEQARENEKKAARAFKNKSFLHVLFFEILELKN